MMNKSYHGARLSCVGLLGLALITTTPFRTCCGQDVGADDITIIQQAVEEAETGVDAAGDALDAELEDLAEMLGETGTEAAPEKLPAETATAVETEAAADVEAYLEDGSSAPDSTADLAEPVEPEVVELSQNEEVRRQELELYAEHLAITAMKAWRQGEFAAAADSYREALDRLESTTLSAPRILEKKEKIKKTFSDLYEDWADALAKDAQTLANSEQCDAAIEKCRMAMELDPSPKRRKDMEERIKECLKLKRDVEFREVTAPERIMFGREDRDFEINVLLEQGRVFMQNRRFADARDLFEQVLLKDPYEVRAIRELRRINEQVNEVAIEKHRATVQERLSEVLWKWSEPVTPLLAASPDLVGQSAIRKLDGEGGIRAKLRDIVIPSISFDDMPVDDVVRQLKERSIELDPDGEGVNIFLHLTPAQPQAQAGQGALPPGAGPGAFPGVGPDAGMFPGGPGGGMPGGRQGAGGAGGGMPADMFGPGMAGAAGGAPGGGFPGGPGGFGGAPGGFGGAPGGFGGATGAPGGMAPGMVPGMMPGPPRSGAPGAFPGGGLGAFPGADPFAVGADFTGQDYQVQAPAAAQAPNITMDMDNIPLGELIRYICMVTGLKYRVESYAVIIAHPSVALETMETRFYPVEAGVFDSARTRARAESIDWGSSDDDDSNSSNSNSNNNNNSNSSSSSSSNSNRSNNNNQNQNDEPVVRLNVYQFFVTAGVDFPAGSRVQYFSRLGKLIVTNTPANLRKLEKVLQEVNVTPTQVTIEAKVVEIVQNTLDAIGFEWLLERGWTNYTENPAGSGDWFLEGGPVWNVGNGVQVGMQKDTNLTTGLRLSHQIFEDVVQGSDQVLGVYSVIGDLAFQTIIHALAQKGQADVLSAPKVTTLSGNTAILRMVTERQFPTSWTEPELESSTGTDTSSVSIVPSIPEGFEQRDIGVILEVTPTVASDGYSIDLELRPEVIQFIGYDDSFNYTITLNGQNVEAKALMPIISARTVETKVIVWDGETVVLGGMIGERVQTWDDKVPLLGDIPLIGRLFRTTGDKSEKTNLLIFVTARLVNPAGLPIRANELRGMHDFRH